MAKWWKSVNLFFDLNFVLFRWIATDKYRAGYADCAREVARYLSTPEPPPLPSVPSLADNGCKTRLLRHLDQCIAEIETEICPRILPPKSVTSPSKLGTADTSNEKNNGYDDHRTPIRKQSNREYCFFFFRFSAVTRTFPWTAIRTKTQTHWISVKVE